MPKTLEQGSGSQELGSHHSPLLYSQYQAAHGLIFGDSAMLTQNIRHCLLLLTSHFFRLLRNPLVSVLDSTLAEQFNHAPFPKIHFFIHSVWVSLCMGIYMWVGRSQKSEVSIPLELKLQTAVSHPWNWSYRHLWATLGTEVTVVSYPWN